MEVTILEVEKEDEDSYTVHVVYDGRELWVDYEVFNGKSHVGFVSGIIGFELLYDEDKRLVKQAIDEYMKLVLTLK